MNIFLAKISTASVLLGVAALALLSPQQALAFSPPQQPASPKSSAESNVVEQLRRCQTLQNNEERLNCFDAGMAAFNRASASGEMAIIDRTQIEQTNRQLFGFQVPNLGHLFSTADTSRDDLTEIETTLISAEKRSDGRWHFRLADGSVWKQTNSDRFAVLNRQGDPVRIRKASLNSYLMTVGRARGIRVQRQ